MNNFKIIYQILKHLEENMDKEYTECEDISHEKLGISFIRWENLLWEMQANGYIRGLKYQQTMSDSSPHVVLPIAPKITIKGLEYLESNSFMRKAADTMKRVKEIIPGM
jgi:hypothetical protein